MLPNVETKTEAAAASVRAGNITLNLYENRYTANSGKSFPPPLM